MRKPLSSLLLSILALLFYVAVLPRLGLWLDRRLELIWRLPGWTDPLAGVLLLAGFGFAVRYFCALVFVERPTEPAESPTRTQMIFGAWTFGAGLGLLLRSASLMILAAVIAIAATIYIRWPAQQASLAALIKNIGRLRGRIPAWLTLTLVVIGTFAGFPKITRSVDPPRVSEPAILVQIRCKPGMGELWREDFERYLRPAIEEAVGHKDSYTSFQFLEPALPGQGFDFGLLYTGASFSGLDKPRLFPQYAALLEREGPVRALAISREMGQCEEHVTVSLLHLSRTR